MLCNGPSDLWLYDSEAVGWNSKVHHQLQLSCLNDSFTPANHVRSV